jgi:ParB family transcriptional regulator, chromosome partitioning protein
MAIKDVASGRSDLYRVDPAIIQVKADWNSRDASDPANAEHIATLAASIKEIGVKKPLVGFMEGDVVYVTDGHCRLAAVQQLIKAGVEIKTVPFMVEDRFSNEADRIFSQIVHNSGKPLTGIEQANVFKRLIALGWAQKDIALKAGMSGGRVSQLLELLTLPVVLQKFITDGRASASMVLNTFKKHNGDVALTVAELSGAVQVAEASGRKRAMPKDVDGTGEGGEGSGKAPKGMALKAFIKGLVEKAYADERVDDTENMVTLSLSEDDWAELMEKINY